MTLIGLCDKECDLGGSENYSGVKNNVEVWKTESLGGNDLCMQEFYSMFNLSLFFICVGHALHTWTKSKRRRTV